MAFTAYYKYKYQTSAYLSQKLMIARRPSPLNIHIKNLKIKHTHKLKELWIHFHRRQMT